MRKLEIIRRNIGDHRGLRFESLAKLGDLGVQIAKSNVDASELDRSILLQGPDETIEPTEIERQKYLVVRKHFLQVLDTRRRRVHQIPVIGKFLGDVLHCLAVARLQAGDLRLRVCQRLSIAFGRRHTQKVVESGNGRADLFLGVLRSPHQFCQLRIVGCRTRR